MAETPSVSNLTAEEIALNKGEPGASEALHQADMEADQAAQIAGWQRCKTYCGKFQISSLGLIQYAHDRFCLTPGGY